MQCKVLFTANPENKHKPRGKGEFNLRYYKGTKNSTTLQILLLTTVKASDAVVAYQTRSHKKLSVFFGIESSPVVNRQFPTGKQSVPSEGTIGLQRVPGLEHLADATYGCYQHVDFLLGVVECEGGSYRSCNAQTVHQGLGTVVTGAYGDTQSVE